VPSEPGRSLAPINAIDSGSRIDAISGRRRRARSAPGKRSSCFIVPPNRYEAAASRRACNALASTPAPAGKGPRTTRGRKHRPPIRVSSYAARMAVATPDRPKARSLKPLRALPPLLKPHLPVLAAALGALLIAAAAQLALPIALRFLIDEGLAVQDTATIDRYFIAFIAAAAAFGVFAALRYY